MEVYVPLCTPPPGRSVVRPPRKVGEGCLRSIVTPVTSLLSVAGRFLHGAVDAVRLAAHELMQPKQNATPTKIPVDNQ